MANKRKPWNKGQDCRIDLICPECGCSFKRYPSQIKETNFCKPRCKQDSMIGVARDPEISIKISISNSKPFSEERKANLVGRKPSCGNTGKHHSEESKQKISIANRSKSVETAKKISATKRCVSLENWDGFITSENKRERLRFRQTMQKAVFERDEYTCQECDQRGGRLQAAHILSWAKYPELRFNLDNCRTLCMACHYYETYGKELPEDVTTWGHNLTQIGGVAK